MVDECDSKMVVVSKMVHELLLERGEISADTSPQMLVELDMDPDAIVGVLMMMIKTLYGPIALNVRKEVARAVAAQVRRDNIPPKATAEQGELQQQLLSAFIQLEYRETRTNASCSTWRRAGRHTQALLAHSRRR